MGNRLHPYFLKVLSSLNKPEMIIKELYTYRFYKKCLYPLTKMVLRQSYIHGAGVEYVWVKSVIYSTLVV